MADERSWHHGLDDAEFGRQAACAWRELTGAGEADGFCLTAIEAVGPPHHHLVKVQKRAQTIDFCVHPAMSAGILPAGLHA
jgi:hypothetical protein